MEEQFSTTFWMDSTIADKFGLGAVKDTFERASKEWKSDYQYAAAVKHAYEVACTAEWLYFDYRNTDPYFKDVVGSIEDALEVADDIRWYMFKYDVDEQFSTDEILRKRLERLNEM